MFVMTISAMGKKCVVLGLAICLVLSSFHEVSCQVEGNGEYKSLHDQEMQSTEEERSSSESRTVETESEAVSSQSSSSSDNVKLLLEGFKNKAGSDGANKFSESMDAFGNDAENRKKLEEIERKFKETSGKPRYQPSKENEDLFIDEPRKTASEVEENPFMINEPRKIGFSEGDENPFMINEPKKIGVSGAASTSTESSVQFESKQSSSEKIKGSLGIGESGAWRCVNQNTNGVKDDDDSPIVIPKYDLNDIIKEETSQGSSSKTSSLITSLTEIVEKHRKGRWTDVKIGTVSSKETSERVTKLKTTLKSYAGLHVRDLVTRSDFEEILTMAARYEQLSMASVTYISRLATYTSVIREGFKASQRVQTVHQRVKLHENMAIEKQKRVDAEFASVKAVAQKGDKLSVQIFAMKRLVLKLEAEKRQVDIEFQKIVENLSRVLEESSHAYEKHHVVVREWKQVQSTVEYSRETTEKAEVVWVQFLNTLSN